MKRRSKILVICSLFLLKLSTSFSQIDTSFWFAAPWVTPDHHWKDNYVLHISTFNTANTVVRLRQPSAIAPNKYDTIINIPANSTFDYVFWRDKIANSTNLAFDSLEVRPANTVLPYGLYVSSSANITLVYDVITRPSQFYNPETFSLKGQNGLGTEFVCPFQTMWRSQNLGTNDINNDGVTTQPKQQLNIVATQSNTVVWITPRCNIVGHLANITYSVLLPSPGSAYTCENATQATNLPGNNLSGTIVVSDKPISVTVADDSVDSQGGCYDLMGDQIVPVEIVGKDYILLKGRLNSNEFEGGYIVATENFTQLTINTGVTTTTLLNKGDTYYVPTTTTAQSVCYINASKNVYCLHASGTGCELGEALLPPLNCAGSNLVAFSRNTPQNFFLNILCRNGVQSTFTLNNSAGTVTVPITASDFTVVPGTATLSGGPYYGAQLTLTSTAVLPIGSYTVGNSNDVFALGILDGGATTGGLYHYMSSFLRRNVVKTSTLSPVCVGQNISVPLTGTVSGGALTGTWTTNGNGTFGVYTSSNNLVVTSYTPSPNDLLFSSLLFSLTSLGDCTPVTDTVRLQINQPPALTAGSNQSMCKNNIFPVILTGTFTNAIGATWATSTGSNGGIFGSPGAATTYTPSQGDIAANTITLTLSSVGPKPGCINTSTTMTINFINPALVDPGPDQLACTNSSTVALVGSVSGITSTGNWTGSGTGLFLPGSSYPSAIYQLSAADVLQPQITLTLTSTGSGSLCAEVSKTVAINIIGKPEVTVPANFTVCGNAVIINLTGTVSSGYTGSWISPNGSGSFNQSLPASAIYTMGASDILNGSVNFILTSSGYCPPETNSLTVAILDAPVVIVNQNNSVVCENAPIALTGTVSGYTSTGIWSTNGSGDFSPNNTALGGQYLPSAGDVANGSVVITLSSTQNQGCPATTDAFTAIFISAPLAEYNIALKRCKDEGVLFTNNSLANGTSSLSYAWDFGDQSGLSIALDPLHTYTAIGSYVVSMTVTGTNSLGVSCPDTVSKRVFINNTPVANYDFINGCKDLNTQFRDSSSVFGGSIVEWSWQFGDNSPVATIKNPVHTYTNSGTFNAQLVVTSNNRCTATISKLVNINPSPVAEFGLTNNPAVAQEPIYFSDFSTPTSTIKSWYWEFGDEGSANSQGPSHSYQLAGVYVVTLTVTDDAGCSDTITKSIEITLLPQVPTAFTPNNDGTNDLLYIKGGPFQNILFKVYNSWGELVFETTDQKIGWDGKKNGVDQPVGAYVWTLVVDMYNNRQVKKNGDVSIIR